MSYDKFQGLVNWFKSLIDYLRKTYDEEGSWITSHAFRKKRNVYFKNSSFRHVFKDLYAGKTFMSDSASSATHDYIQTLQNHFFKHMPASI